MCKCCSINILIYAPNAWLITAVGKAASDDVVPLTFSWHSGQLNIADVNQKHLHHVMVLKFCSFISLPGNNSEHNLFMYRSLSG